MIGLMFFVNPSARRVTHTLKRGHSLRIGREDGDLTFPDDELMSSLHLTLNLGSLGVEFTDEGSTNGTFLNGIRSESGVIGADDLLVIGQTHLTLTPAVAGKLALDAAVVSGAVQPSPEGHSALRIECHEGTQQRVLPGQQLSVGRTEKSQWMFADDDLMSGLHFVISDEAGQWEVCDARSLNGTLLNSQRIERAVVHNGDAIAAGNTQFRVWLEALPSPDSPNSIKAVPQAVPPVPVVKPIDQLSGTDTHESSSIEKHIGFAYVWLADLTGRGTSMCLKKGSELRLEPVGKRGLNYQLRIDWSGAHCRARTEGDTPSEFLVNETVNTRRELNNGDVLHWSDLKFQVLYTDSPQMSPLPAVAAFNPSSLPPTPPPRLSEPERRDKVEPSVAAQQLDPQAQQPAAAQSAGHHRPAESTEPRTPPAIASASAPKEQERPANDTDKDQVIIPELVKPAPHTKPNRPAPVPAPPASAPAAHTGAQVLQNPLPGDDPIELLLKVSSLQKCWLISFDPKYPEHPSIPIEITSQDTAWMQQVLLGWPQNLFMIVLADSNNEEILAAVLGAAPKPMTFTAANCLKWLKEDRKVWSATPIRSVILLDSPNKNWCLISGSAISSHLQKVIAGN